MRVGITGHRGLPEETAVLVRAEIDHIINGHVPHELIGMSCIADGPDTWFASGVLDHGSRLEVVLPADDYRDALPDWHHATYDTIIARASEVHSTGLTTSNDQAFMTASELLVGLVDELIAVWDGQAARGFGGTADVVRYAQSVGVPVRVVWPRGASRD